MDRKTLRPVKHIDIKDKLRVSALVDAMASAGAFGAGKLARATRIYQSMIDDPACKIFFGVAGAMVPGGMKHILIDLIEHGRIDVLVTTGANLTHDMIEALGNHRLPLRRHLRRSPISCWPIPLRFHDVGCDHVRTQHVDGQLARHLRVKRFGQSHAGVLRDAIHTLRTTKAILRCGRYDRAGCSLVEHRRYECSHTVGNAHDVDSQDEIPI